MRSFELAIPIILKHEGLLVDDPSDAGGITNYGISLRFLLSTGDLNKDGLPDGDIDNDGDIDAEDIKKLNIIDAKKLYKLYWWDKYGYDAIESPAIAAKVFDLAVNMGAKQAHKCLQRALRANKLTVDDDGLLGIKTFKAVNQVIYVSLIAALRSEAAGFYRSLNKPKYLNGWLNRAYD